MATIKQVIAGNAGAEVQQRSIRNLQEVQQVLL